MKKPLFTLGLFLLVPMLAKADLPSSAITNLTMNIYGFYTTADPTCQTGFVALIPTSATLTSVNLAATNAPTIGTGTLSANIQCIMLVLKNTVSLTVSPGTYTTSSVYEGNSFSDSVCNNGFSQNETLASGVLFTPVWPPSTSLPMTDISAAGLTPASTLQSAAGNEVIPLYLSTDSACTGNPQVDSTSCVDLSPGSFAFPNPEAPPTASGDKLHGLKTTSPAQATTYVFAMNASQFIGGQSGSTCSAVGVPFWAFVAQ